MLEKFDFSEIAQNLLSLGNTMEKTNTNMNENVSNLKSIIKNEKIACEKENKKCDEVERSDVTKLREESEMSKKEAMSYQNSYELMTQTVTERDKELKSSRESSEKMSQALQEKDRQIISLDTECKRFKEGCSRDLQEKMALNNELHKQITKLEEEKRESYTKIDELTEKYTTIYARWESYHAVNEQLEIHVDSLIEINKQLQTSLESAVSNNSNTIIQNREILPPEIETKNYNHNNEKVVILHDSLCGKINDTILSRERVATKKVWAPDLVQMENKLDEIEKIEVIVIQALTRDLEGKDVEYMNEGINKVITKALTKAQKVVVSTIIRRDDVKQIGAKAELVNAKLKYKYVDDDVIICDNQNLYDSKFRLDDSIHLTPHGTSVFATNLKHMIAKALNISVIKKEKSHRNYSDNRGDNTRRDFFGNGYFNDRGPP